MFYYVGFYILLGVNALLLLRKPLTEIIWKNMYRSYDKSILKYKKSTEELISIQREHIALLEERLRSSRSHVDQAIEVIRERDQVIETLIQSFGSDFIPPN